MRQGGQDNRDYTQKAGIRQCCPLSPSLFLVAMSALMADVKQAAGAQGARDKIGGIFLDEMLYADDTMLLLATMRGLQRYLWEI